MDVFVFACIAIIMSAKTGGNRKEEKKGVAVAATPATSGLTAGTLSIHIMYMYVCMTITIIVDSASFPKEEEKILSYWAKIDAFKTSLKMSEGRPEYTFYGIYIIFEITMGR